MTDDDDLLRELGTILHGPGALGRARRAPPAYDAFACARSTTSWPRSSRTPCSRRRPGPCAARASTS